MKMHCSQFRSAFTLIELMVAIALLMGVILCVGLIFQGTTRAVTLSQATAEMLSGVRAMNTRIEKDLAAIDPAGFLVIRSRSFTPAATSENPEPFPHRFDQIAFLASGDFRNATGTINGGKAHFVDRSVANAARIWYGHLVVCADGGTATFLNGGSYFYKDQSKPVPQDSLPSGQREQDFVLGRHVMGLYPDDGYNPEDPESNTYSSVTSIANIPILATRRDTSMNIRWQPEASPCIIAKEMPLGEQINLSITSSRCGAAGYTSALIMKEIVAKIPANGGRAGGEGTLGATWETDNYCFRYHVLPDLWSNSFNSVTNGYFRMHPILQKGVASFAVDWTDGTCSDSTGEVIWYGLTNPKRGASPPPYTITEPKPSSLGADQYVAQFSFDSKGSWPKALRFTYRITDPANRLAGGRTFVQIVTLPY